MREVALVALLLLVPLTGCLDGDEGPQPLTLEAPSLPQGLLLTYTYEDGPRTGNGTFVTLSQGAEGHRIIPWNTTETVNSPFLRLDENLNPRRYDFSGILSWPLSAGDSYEAPRVGGAEATVSVTETTFSLGDVADGPALELTATGADGEPLLSLTLLSEPTVVAELAIDTPDGTEERWELTAIEHRPGIDRPPRWRLGDWWTYDASTQAITGTPQLVYTQNETGQQSIIAVLEPTELDDRVLALPFQRFTTNNMAPQSGFVSTYLSKFWEWPLQDGKFWNGATVVGQEHRDFRAEVHLLENLSLPDGSTSMGYEVLVRVIGTGEIFAEYTYAPRVQHLVEFNITPAGDEQVLVDWQLEAWGSGFHGEIEIPRTMPLVNEGPASGPETIRTTFNVTDQVDVLRTRGFLGLVQEGSPNGTVRLLSPAGEAELEIDSREEVGSRRVSLERSIAATAGEWELHADLSNGASMLLSIDGVWSETQQVDYR